MPLQACSKDGQSGWQWGSGACHVGENARERALAEGVAAGEISETEASKTLAEAASAALKAIIEAAGRQNAIKFNDERQEATGVLVVGFDGTLDTVDLDDEAMLPEDALKLMRSYMLNSILHGHDDQHDRLPYNRSIVEIFFNDERIASPNFPPNSGVVTLYYPDPEDWALVKSGERKGFSYDATTVAVIAEVEMLVPASEIRT